MHTIIIGEGLTNEVLSPQHHFLQLPQNVGQREIDRLMGRGKESGKGPVPTILEQVLAARRTGSNIAVILLGGGGKAGAERDFVESIDSVAREAAVVHSAYGSIPWEELQQVIADITGCDAASLSQTPLRVLVLGCHTEHHIQALTTLLQTFCVNAEIAVDSHLVGSATQEAHFAVLRHSFPGAGVRVLLDLAETAEFLGLSPEPFSTFNMRPCAIEPPEVLEAINPSQRRIIELLCMHWTRTHLRPLAGGFSGSLLFLADGWKGEARTEPLVLKIDGFRQMRRELDGYHQVKDFFGKHVPTFGYPVGDSEALGVGMELAAMEGRPETLQEAFEEAEGEASLAAFLERFDKALSLLGEKLYRNTRESAWVVPYRMFGLHAEQQLVWLRENADIIQRYLAETRSSAARVDVDQLVQIVHVVAANPDSIESEVCISHGDINYANIIFDAGTNIWIIDWTHSGVAPIELDFCKLENDVKFVISKAFDVGDLDRLRQFDEYLLAQRMPADVDGLPDNLKFAKWDFRFRKLLSTVRRIRQVCFSLKESDDWLAYRVGLLRYAMHTLSFDKRRQRGECELPQLMHALYSVDSLTLNLVADDFHLKIRAERPADYPPRQRISIDEAPWVLDCPDYDPPYYVHQSVLDNDRSKVSDGWADPEDVSAIQREIAARPAKRRDEQGLPLNPRGRTGIAGRGLLGRWGSNLSLAAAPVRLNGMTGELEILLGRLEGETELSLPKGFVLPTETPEACLARVVRGETGWDAGSDGGEVVFEGYTYDSRQTDHAWVESRAYLLFDDKGTFRDIVSSGSGGSRIVDAADTGPEFDEVEWWPLNAATVNRVPSGSARVIRESVRVLMESGRMETDRTEELLAKTG